MLTADTLLREAAARWPQAPALWRDGTAVTYADLDHRVERTAAGLRASSLLRGSRVAVWLDKRVDTVVALFAAMRAGHVAVPVNPALRAPQVLACLADCGAALLIGDRGRLAGLGVAHDAKGAADRLPDPPGTLCLDVEGPRWQALSMPQRPASAAVMARDSDELAILFYTSGSTGAAKGVMVTHANLLAGAAAVNAHLRHGPGDRLLAALPLAFDAGFSQLACAFAAGASVVLLDHLFPNDVLTAIDDYQVTGLTAVPPLYLQLLRALQQAREGPRRQAGHTSLRYLANTGGHLPREAWLQLRRHWPGAEPVAMYGLTEAFRASRLPPEDFDRKPDSIGLAVPGGTRLHVLRADGTPCAAGEPGELVQQGPLVARGYWNDPARSAQRFRPGPDGAPAVWSGDTVRRDAEGYLWFVGRSDEQIKTSGYRVSPTEVEAAAAAAGRPECVAVGVPDALLGQVIVLVVADAAAAEASPGAASGRGGDRRVGAADAVAPWRHDLLAAMRAALPAWMVPRHIDVWPGVLPRNANGKFDRVQIRRQTQQRHADRLPVAGGDGND